MPIKRKKPEHTPDPSRDRKRKKPDAVEYKRILVPVDFSEYSKHALDHAILLAREFDSELVLVYVAESAVYPADFGFGQVTIPSFERELADRGKKELERLIKEKVGESIPARAIVKTGRPFIEILNTAGEIDADLIIIATHGHTGMEHMIFGSTAEKVVRRATCPVLTVR